MTLHLTLRRRWFDMILSGGKSEEYRDITGYWISRLTDTFERDRKTGVYRFYPKYKKIVHFYNGGSPCLKYPNFKIECLEITIGKGKPDIGAPMDREVFIIKLGKIIEEK